MEQYQTFKKMAQFNKTAFDYGYNTIAMFREQNEKMANSLLDKATWMPEEGKEKITDCMAYYKAGCEDFKKLADQNYQNFEKCLTSCSN